MVTGILNNKLLFIKKVKEGCIWKKVIAAIAIIVRTKRKNCGKKWNWIMVSSLLKITLLLIQYFYRKKLTSPYHDFWKRCFVGGRNLLSIFLQLVIIISKHCFFFINSKILCEFEPVRLFFHLSVTEVSS